MSTITSSSHSFTDFTELAERLQNTAQALLAIGSPIATEPEDEPPPAEGKAPPEIRSFRIPGFMVAEEKEMLELLKAESWQHMFDKTYEQLYTMALLMQHFEADEEIDGFSIQLMGNTLMAPLDMLSRLCCLIADFRPVSEDDSEVD